MVACTYESNNKELFVMSRVLQRLSSINLHPSLTMKFKKKISGSYLLVCAPI